MNCQSSIRFLKYFLLTIIFSFSLKSSVFALTFPYASYELPLIQSNRLLINNDSNLSDPNFKYLILWNGSNSYYLFTTHTTLGFTSPNGTSDIILPSDVKGYSYRGSVDDSEGISYWWGNNTYGSGSNVGSFILNDSWKFCFSSSPINQTYTPSLDATVCKFIQPNVSPFKDTTSGYNFLISYSVPSGTTADKVSININSPNISSTDFSITGQEYNITTGDGWVKVFATNVSVGVHVVTATVNNKVATTTIERLGGSVDVDGDGIDDRTGQPVDDGHAPLPSENPSNVIDSVNQLTGFMSSMSVFATKIFSFMPTEVKVIMAFVITVMGFIAIKKMIL